MKGYSGDRPSRFLRLAPDLRLRNTVKREGIA